MKVLLEAPILTRSGYGEHARFVFRALRLDKDLEIFINPLNWGKTKWLTKETEEKQEIDKHSFPL